MKLALSATDGRRIAIPVETAAVWVLCLFVGVVVLDSLGFSVALLRPALAFCLLTFVPGALVVTLFGFGPRPELRWGLYVVGVSLLTILAVGLIINLTYPVLGVVRPLSPMPLVVTFGLLTLGLVVAIRRIDPPRDDLSVPLAVEVTPMPLALLSLPLLSILAVKYLNVTDANVPILLVLGVVSVLPLAVAVGAIRARWHALCLWALATALLYHKSLWLFHAFSGQGNIVAAWQLGRWTPAATSQTAAVTPLLPNVMFSSTYAHLGGLGIFTQLEVVNPLLVSLIPVCMFVTFRRYVSFRDAFIGACVFAFAHPFYFQLPTGGRAATPVLFLAFCGLVLTDSRLTSFERRSLWLGFTAGYVVSHYGAAYLFLLAVTVAVVLLALFWRLDTLSVSAVRMVASDGGSTDQRGGYERVAAVVGRLVRERWTRLSAVSLFVGVGFAVTTAGGVWVAFHAIVVQSLGLGRIPYLEEWLGMPRTLAVVTVATAVAVVTFAGTLAYYLVTSLTTTDSDEWEWERASDEHCPDATTARTGNRLLSPAYMVLYAVATVGWYMYTYGGEKLDILFEHVVTALMDLYTSTGGGGGTANRLAKDYGATSIQVSKYLYVVIAGLLFVGLLAAYRRRFLTHDSEFDDEFLALSTALFCGFGLSLFMAGSWGGGRPMALAFCITGVFAPLGARALGHAAIAACSVVGRRFGLERGENAPPIGRLGIAALLAVLLVVNTGVAAAVVFGGTAPSNVPLQAKFATSQNPDLRSEVYSESDITMYVWLVSHRDPSLLIYGDWLTIIQYNQWYRPQVTAYVDPSRPYGAIQYQNTLLRLDGPDNRLGYVMLGGHNTALGVIDHKTDTASLAVVERELSTRDKIFTTGHSVVYLAEE